MKFAYDKGQKVEVQVKEGTHYWKGEITSRVPSEPHILYRVRLAAGEEVWADEKHIRKP